MTISNYAELKILDHATGRAAWTAPTNVYIKLHTADPGEDGTTAAATETTRKVTAWNVAAAGAITITTTLAWTAVAATETYTHWSAWDTVGPAGGNCIWTGALSASAAMTAGDNFSLTALSLTLD